MSETVRRRSQSKGVTVGASGTSARASNVIPMVAHSDDAPAPPTYRRSATRKNMKAVQAAIPVGAHQQLAILALRQRKTIEAVLEEALDRLFDARGLPAIATRRGRARDS